jgi:hypothetical protein
MNGTNESPRITERGSELSALLAQWAKKNFPAADVTTISRCLGLDWKKIRQLDALAECSTAVQAAVFNNKLHVENAAAFGALNAVDQEAFLSLSSELHLSLQTEREFLEWLPEIAYSGAQGIAAVLASDQIKGCRDDAVLTAPQKIQRIRAYIFSIRFPRYDAALKRWKQIANKTFGQTPNIAITPSPFFEKDKLELRIAVSRADEAFGVMQKLAALPKSAWASLIDPMKY